MQVVRGQGTTTSHLSNAQINNHKFDDILGSGILPELTRVPNP